MYDFLLYSFPITHTIGNIGIFVYLKLEDKLDI